MNTLDTIEQGMQAAARRQTQPEIGAKATGKLQAHAVLYNLSVVLRDALEGGGAVDTAQVRRIQALYLTIINR